MRLVQVGVPLLVDAPRGARKRPTATVEPALNDLEAPPTPTDSSPAPASSQASNHSSSLTTSSAGLPLSPIQARWQLPKVARPNAGADVAQAQAQARAQQPTPQPTRPNTPPPDDP